MTACEQSSARSAWMDVWKKGIVGTGPSQSCKGHFQMDSSRLDLLWALSGGNTATAQAESWKPNGSAGYTGGA